MKKTNALLKLATVLVFLAMAAYMGIYIANRFIDPVQTALTVTATMTDSSTMSGLVVRDELVIKNNAQYIDVIVGDGEKVSAGETIALIYGSQDALQRAVQLGALDREIDAVEAALDRTGGVLASGSRDRSVYDALTGLSAAVRGGGLIGADTQQSALASLIFRTDVTDANEDYLEELRASRAELAAAVSGETDRISVSQSGTFSSLVDGFEGVSPQYVEALTPDDLREVIAAERVVTDDSLGKLVTSYDWYYAAIVSQEDASRLVAGMTVQLSFGRYHNGYLTAEVEYVGRAQQREQLILFRLEHGFDDMLAVRAVAAELVYNEYTGLRVPLKGLYRYYAGYMSDEDGASLSPGGSVALSLGGRSYDAIVSEVGSARRYGELPPGVAANSDLDTRPTRRLVVFCWPWADEPAPDESAGTAVVTAADGARMNVASYYEYEEGVDRMCVFAMTGLQAERKKVELIYAGDEYGLVRSEGDDALREGNEIIVRASDLYNGRVFH